MTSQTNSPASAGFGRESAWRYIFAGLCASLVSIGLARFGFTPLIPELIRNHWFSTSSVIYLGAANLAGYVCGALVARPLGRRLGNSRTLRLMMLVITATFLACAFPLSVSWYFIWRVLSGVAGGVVMVLVAATILPHVPPASKGRAGGAIFLGLGLGIAGTGTIIPLLLTLGLANTWIGLACVSALLTAASWFAWPRQAGAAALPTASTSQQAAGRTPSGWRIRLLYAQYALLAASVVSPMVFLVDYIARGLGMGTQYGALFWVLYGVGAIAGPPLYGLIADRMSARIGIRLVAVVQIAALVGMYCCGNHVALGAFTVLIGMFAPGIVPMVLARVHELVPGNAPWQNLIWSRATIISAGLMAVAGYAFSALFNATGGNHRLVFLAAAGLVLIALGGELPWPAGRPQS